MCGVHRADYVRAAEQCYAAIGPEIARAREAAEVGAARGGDDEALIELPPSLSRMLVRAADAATDAAADAKHFRLFVVRTHIHISRGGTRVAGVEPSRRLVGRVSLTLACPSVRLRLY